MKIVFDGNIGCGKSSILKLIQNNKPIEMNIYNEPLHDWSKWLELFYSDMKKHSFGFQMRVLKSHLDKKDILNGIFERSPLSCQRVFGELLFEDKKMNELEWNLTNEFNYDYGWNPDYVVYLKCDPQICYQRIKQRNRNDEQSIDINYLERIHQKYEKLYTDCKSFKVITIDSSNSIEKVYEDVMELVIKKIRFSITRTTDFPIKAI